MKTNIIGISGTNGSGKDTIGHILVDTFGFIFVSVTDSLRTEASKRGKLATRDLTAQISAEWRRQFGMAVLVDKVVDQYTTQLEAGSKLAMASLRHPAEVDRIHELGGTVVWLDADPRIRYDRIQANVAARNKTAVDAVSFEQFLTEEAAEMHPTGDDATLNMAAVKAKADVFIVNDGNNLEELVIKLAQQLKLPLA